MEVLEKAVQQRIEGTQVEERGDNKMWLVRYLEVSSQVLRYVFKHPLGKDRGNSMKECGDKKM